MLIPEIRKNDADGQYRLKIIRSFPDDKTHRIVASFTPTRLGLMSGYTHTMVNFVVTNRRLEKLANDVLKELDKKARWEAWRPTMDELEQRLDEIYHGEGVYIWFINWARQPKNKAVTKKIYEWLKIAEEMAKEMGTF